MKSFIVKFLIILVSLVCVDFLVGRLGDWIILKEADKNYTGNTARLNYSLNGSKEDVVILGSSEAACAYIPSLITKRLLEETGKNYSAYNAGTTSQGVSFCYCVERGLIERHTPKVIVLDLVWSYLYPIEEEQNNTMLSPVRPYSKINQNVKDLLDRNDGKKERILSYSNMYRLNSEIIKFFFLLSKSQLSDGHISYNKVMSRDAIKESDIYNESIIDQSKVEDFKHFIRLAEENDVKIVCTVTPKYRIMPMRCGSYRTMLKICKEHEIPVCEIYKDTIFDNPSLYYNPSHLNTEGAILATSNLVDMLSDILK